MDFLSFFTMLALVLTGMLFIRGAGMDYGMAPPSRWILQGIWAAFGLILYFGCSLVDYRRLGRFSWIVFLAGFLLLIMVFISGGKDNGARSVLKLPGVSIQVSELMKAAALLFIAWVLSHPLLKFSLLPPIVVWGIITAVPVGLVFLHGDGGTALVFIPFSFAILFINGLKWRWIAVALVIVLFATPSIYPLLKPYQKSRILVFAQTPCRSVIDAAKPFLSAETHSALHAKLDRSIDDFLDHNRDDNGEKLKLNDWNAKQAIYSVASGGKSGRGYMKGFQHTLGFLPRPVAPTDFIFAVICEESGFAGALCVIAMLLLLIILTVRTALHASDMFGMSIAIGAAFIFATHAFINIGMCIGYAPIIGIPLPFVSYGGSCMFGMMLVAGLVQSVHVHGQRDDAMEQKELPELTQKLAWND